MANINRKTIVRALNVSSTFIESYGMLSTVRWDSFNRCDDAFNAAAIDVRSEVLALAIVAAFMELVSFMSIFRSFMVSLCSDGGWLAALLRFGRWLCDARACSTGFHFHRRMYARAGNSVTNNETYGSEMERREKWINDSNKDNGKEQTTITHWENEENELGAMCPGGRCMQCECVCVLCSTQYPVVMYCECVTFIGISVDAVSSLFSQVQRSVPTITYYIRFSHFASIITRNMFIYLFSKYAKRQKELLHMPVRRMLVMG